jgi:uncharacterized protein with NAD-binding domain and iron-sulfur cluster
VLGGGVAGLSAAHELAERGFEVTVHEQRDAPGGKARSIPVAGSGTGELEPTGPLARALLWAPTLLRRRP